MAWAVIGSKAELAIILVNGHAISLPSKYLRLHPRVRFLTLLCGGKFSLTSGITRKVHSTLSLVMSYPEFLKLILEVTDFVPNLQMLVICFICLLLDIYRQSSCSDENNSIKPDKNKLFWKKKIEAGRQEGSP